MFTTKSDCYKNNQAHFFRASLKFLNRPSDDTSFWILSITVFVWGGKKFKEEVNSGGTSSISSYRQWKMHKTY